MSYTHQVDTEARPLFVKTPPRDGIIQYFRYGFKLFCVERFRIASAQHPEVPGNLIGIRVWFLSVFIMLRK